MHRRQAGLSLVELMVGMAISTALMLIGWSSIESVRRGYALNSATAELRATIQYVRMLAIARDRNVAIRFRAEERAWTWTVYEDGDGDGVRNDDIDKGKDPQIIATRSFQHGPGGIGLPAGKVPDPMAPGQTLSARLPVRFNVSMLCSFTRKGEVTNGSVVLSDGRNATIVRVHGTSGRIQVLRWNGNGWRVGA